MIRKKEKQMGPMIIDLTGPDVNGFALLSLAKRLSKKFGVENGDYYGLLNYKNAWVKTQINEGNIEKIQVKDKTASTILNIIVPLAILTTVTVIFTSNICR